MKADICLIRIGPECNQNCVFCNAKKEVTQQSPQIISLIQQGRKDKDSITFTGGEPFLELRLLQKLVDLSASRLAQTEVVTNGHWASSPFEAEKTLKPLKESGLDVLNLSIDDYHSEFIPINSVKNAYYAALSLDLRPIIMTTRQKNSKKPRDSRRG